MPDTSHHPCDPQTNRHQCPILLLGTQHSPSQHPHRVDAALKPHRPDSGAQTIHMGKLLILSTSRSPSARGRGGMSRPWRGKPHVLEGGGLGPLHKLCLEQGRPANGEWRLTSSCPACHAGERGGRDAFSVGPQRSRLFLLVLPEGVPFSYGLSQEGCSFLLVVMEGSPFAIGAPRAQRLAPRLLMNRKWP